MKTITELKALLTRVAPATRSSLEDAKAAAETIRNVAREAGWAGPVIEKSGEFNAGFLSTAIERKVVAA